MKKLTKVFLTVMIVVILAATAVTAVIVGGEVVYNGNLDRANELLAAVDTKTGDKVFEKLDALATLDTYIIKTPVDPATEGYDAFLANYNAKVVETINTLASAAAGLETPTEKADAYAKIYASLAVISENTAIYDKNTAGYSEALANAIKGGYDVAASYIDTAATVSKNVKAAYDAYVASPEDASLISALDTKYANLAEAMKSIHMFTSKLPLGWQNYASSVEGFDAMYASLQEAEAVELYAMVADYNNTEKRATAPLLAHSAYNAAADRLAVGVALSTVVLEAAEYVELKALVDAVYADIDARNAQKKLEATNRAAISEYEYTGNAYNYTFSDGKIPWTYSNSDHTTNASTGSYYELKTDANGDKYLALHCGTQNSTVGGTQYKPESAYMNIGATNTQNGFVLEFDISTEYGGELQYLQIYCYETGKTTGKRMGAYFLGVKDGVIYAPSEKGGSVDFNTPLTDKVIVPGAYTHITIAYDAKNLTAEMFVDYQSIRKTSVAISDKYDLTAFRFANATTAAKGQTIVLDNVVGYKGTMPRTVQSISGYSDGEKFKFYADYALDTAKNPVFRSAAYEKAAKLYDSFKNNASYKEVAEAFNAIDYQNEIFLPAREGCMIEFENLLANLTKTSVTTANIASKSEEIANIEEYLNNHLSFYNQAAEDFVGLKAILNDAKKQITYTQNLQSFLDTIKKFQRADAYAALYRHMNSAKTYFDFCGLSDPEKYEAIKDDTNVDLLESSLGMTIIEFYELMPSVVAQSRAKENSARILSCIDLILNGDYGENVSYEATQAFWEANYDYINKYVLVIRRIVASGEYDKDYVGVEEAVAIYNSMDAYFYELLQREHAEEITLQLAKYSKTDSYIEKLGICTFINNYIEINDVDTSREDISALLFTLSVYEAEVEGHKETYADILEENTEYFIGTANKMLAYNDYTNLYALYIEAQTYFYGMNIDSEEAKVAIAIYNECEAKINEMTYNADAFAGYVSLLRSASTRAKQYQYLVECSKYVEFVDTGITGMEAAVSIYTESLNDYNGVRTSSEAETSVLDTVACATRVFSVPASILAVIKNIFS